MWLAVRQWQPLALGVMWGVVWMVCLSLTPAVLGRAIGSGIAGRDTGALVQWTLIALLITIVTVISGICRHRNTMANIYASKFRTVQVVTRHVTRLGATLPKAVSGGEVVTIGGADLNAISGGFQFVSIAAGSVAAVCVVGVIMFSASVPLGLTVLLGVPALMAITGALMKPLHRRQSRYRTLQSGLAAKAIDIAAGLRVLRGIGGERTFGERYRVSSQEARAAGVQVVRVESMLGAMQVFAPGVFAAGVTWLAATFVIRHEISVGSMIAFYGYATFLSLPLEILAQSANVMTTAYVSADRVARFLRLEPQITGPESAVAGAGENVPEEARAAGALLADADSGLAALPDGLLGVVCADTLDAGMLAERLARFADSGRPTLGGVRLADLPVAWLRRRILLSRNEDRLFRGPLSTELTAPGQDIDVARLTAAMHAAAAEDLFGHLDAGLDTVIQHGAKNFSGGQQQRLRLTRALAAEPETLILVDPTSAVDALTEARIAERLPRYRERRSTIVFTSSPLLLEQADEVCLVERGTVTASGKHQQMLTDCAAYRAIVTRGEA
jgi:ABC-type multidrug transport system fused ATPase/permease subunit